MEVLATRGLSAGFGDRAVVRDVSIRVLSGERVLLLGPNASGKSTLLATIMGSPRVRVFSGSIVYMGEDITGLGPVERSERGIAIMVQSPPRLRGVRVYRLLDKIASRHTGSLTERERLVREVARALNIEYLLEREFGRGFSGGEMKRVELATLILSRPRLALIDEPDSGVDVDSLMLMASAIRDYLAGSSDAMVIVTHTGGVARYIEVSRSYVMYGGRVVYEGGGEVLDKLFSEGFRAFLGGVSSG